MKKTTTRIHLDGRDETSGNAARNAITAVKPTTSTRTDSERLAAKLMSDKARAARHAPPQTRHRGM